MNCLKIHNVKRYPALYTYFKDKEAHLANSKQDVPGSIHGDDSIAEEIVEESKEDNS
jgi:hypothetical protein